MASDLSPLDIKHLGLLDQLYSLQSVTRAAEALNQSQPTLSIWLGKARQQLGDPLFVRTADGMLPTPRMDALIGTVREALGALERLAEPSASFDPGKAERRFSICMTDASHITLLPRLLAHVRALAPGVSLAASRIDAQLGAALQSGDADLGLGFLPWLDTGFYQQALYGQDWICLVNAQHPRIPSAAPEHWNLAAYRREAHIGTSPGSSYQILDDTLRSLHIERRIQLEMPGFLGLGAVLSTCDLVATLPRHIGETLARHNGLLALPCPFQVQGFTVKQYWHARYHHDPASRWLRGICSDLFLSGSGHLAITNSV
jgi:DNA-binding transcriptional LysR family regulator